MATADELRAAIEAHGVPLATSEELDAMGPEAWRRVRLAAVWKQPKGLLERCGPGLKVAMSLGAGVDFLLGSPAVLAPDGKTVLVPETPSLLPAVAAMEGRAEAQQQQQAGEEAGQAAAARAAPSPPPPPQLLVARIVDPHMASRMATWVAWGLLTWQRRMLEYGEYQRRSEWAGTSVERGHNRDACDVSVGVLGYGVMGRAACCLLARMGYRVSAWARRSRRGRRRRGGEEEDEAAALEEEEEQDPEGWEAAEGGKAPPPPPPPSPGRIRVRWPRGGGGPPREQLRAFVQGKDVLVVLLPLTPDTARCVDADLLAQLAPGALLVNGARGAHVDSAAALAALDAPGQLGMALLDVFDEEPLPPESPLWRHPRVVVTPHSAAFTEVARAAEQVGRAWRAVVAEGEPAAWGGASGGGADALARALGANLVDREAGY
jgi:glyoxylate/hydroxypyruvate reductase